MILCYLIITWSLCNNRCPILPEDRSDDSCMSVEEDLAEAPMSELPLKDAVEAAGSDVMIQSAIEGNAGPRGKISQT